MEIVLDYGDGLPAGTRLRGGEYEILSEAGRGGFGITYRARSRTWDATVAIKELFLSDGHVCRREPGGTRILTDGRQSRLFSDYKARFREEANALFRISHAHVAKVFDRFEENHTLYLVMEWVEGATLEDHIREHGALTEEQSLRIIRALAQSLERVHHLGLLHRDVSPRNVLLRGAPVPLEPVLIDFGAAREFVAQQTRGLTVTVTAGYSAPESYSSTLPRGPYTDIYSLGAVWFYLLTSRPPPEPADRTLGLELRVPDTLSSGIAEILRQAMALKPQERMPNASVFLQSLGGVSGQEGSQQLDDLRAELAASEKARKASEDRERALRAKLQKQEQKQQAAQDELAADGYRDNGDGTVTDLGTGLTWMRYALGQRWVNGTCQGEALAVTFDEAKMHVERISRIRTHGASDWRMPSKDELLTLVRRNQKPTINRAAFPNTPSTYFWSGSPDASDSSKAWVVGFYDGHANDGYSSDRGLFRVRLVRGGQ